MKCDILFFYLKKKKGFFCSEEIGGRIDIALTINVSLKWKTFCGPISEQMLTFFLLRIYLTQCNGCIENFLLLNPIFNENITQDKHA